MRVTLNLDDDVHRDVRFLAVETGLTMGEVITVLLRKEYGMPNDGQNAKRLLAYLEQPDRVPLSRGSQNDVGKQENPCEQP